MPAVPGHADTPDARSSVEEAVSFLDAMSSAYPASGSPTLPQSYADELGLFSTSFVYDAAGVRGPGGRSYRSRAARR